MEIEGFLKIQMSGFEEAFRDNGPHSTAFRFKLSLIQLKREFKGELNEFKIQPEYNKKAFQDNGLHIFWLIISTQHAFQNNTDYLDCFKV